jgi:predicted GIY-YIG superfamily endonuclease
MLTYIIKTINGEYYCGKTINLFNRLQQHRNEKKPNWFGFKNRKSFMLKYVIDGDYEKQIKRAGIKFIVYILDNASAS